LHLINTIGDSRLLSSRGKLKILEKLIGVLVCGVAPYGKTIGFWGCYMDNYRFTTNFSASLKGKSSLNDTSIYIINYLIKKVMRINQ